MRAPEAASHTRTVVVAAGVAVGVALAAWMWFSRADAGRATAPGSAGPKAWYTVDDGRTWFADAADKVVPFNHQGKQAYRCFVWTCDGGKTKFASHLERMKPSFHAQWAAKGRLDPWERVPRMDEVKPPLTGDRGWIESSSPQAAAVMTPRCSDGRDLPQPVPPE